jgi:hypothetical protein
VKYNTIMPFLNVITQCTCKEDLKKRERQGHGSIYEKKNNGEFNTYNPFPPLNHYQM